MNAYLILFKSGASVTVYTEDLLTPSTDEATLWEEFGVSSDEVAGFTDLTANQANQLAWVKENESMLESLKHKVATIEHEANARGQMTAQQNIERTKVKVP